MRKSNFEMFYRHEFWFFCHKIEIWIKHDIQECSCKVDEDYVIDCEAYYNKYLEMDEYLVEPLIELTMKELLLLAQIPSDETNNATDDRPSGAKK